MNFSWATIFAVLCMFSGKSGVAPCESLKATLATIDTAKRTNNSQEVLRLAEIGLKDEKQIHVHPHSDIGRISTLLGHILLDLGELDRAEVAINEALPIALSELGNRDSRYARIVATMAEIQQRKLNFPLSEELARKALEIVTTNDSSKADTVPFMMILSDVLTSQSKFQEAIETQQTCLEIVLSEHCKPEHEVARFIEVCIATELELDHYEKALMLIKKAFVIREKSQVTSPIEYAILFETQSSIASRQQKYSEAIPLLKQAVSIREGVQGKYAKALTDPLINLGWLNSVEGRFHDAIAAYEQLYTIIDITDRENIEFKQKLLAQLIAIASQMNDNSKRDEYLLKAHRLKSSSFNF